MSDIAIRVEGIGKKYKIGRKKSGELRESFSQFLDKFKRSSPSGISMKESSTSTDFWALKDITFEVKQGEAVGIIGRNGAGKSTLLKVLSRITKPTTGRFEINGRVSSLLEVGTGFHPELTGRENIFLNGTILGMRRAEIKAKFDEIIDFSGVEEFIDTPVKHYSSGMKVRLAFSVAAHLEPEILIIDEVLAVGDAEFQKKCLGKMEDVTGEGRTVLFVSHNMGAVKKLCCQGIVISNGHLSFRGNIEAATDHYLNNFIIHQFPNNNFRFKEVEVLDASLKDSSNKSKQTYNSQSSIIVSVNINIKYDIKNFKFGIEIEDQYSTKIISSYHNDIAENYENTTIKKGLYAIECILPENLFNNGKYYVNLLLGIHQVKWIYKLERILNFTIDFSILNTKFSANKRDSLLAPMLEWNLKNHD